MCQAIEVVGCAVGIARPLTFIGKDDELVGEVGECTEACIITDIVNKQSSHEESR